MPPAGANPDTAPGRRLNAVSASGRVLSGVIAAMMLAVLCIAAWVRPSPDGHGTHTQLGMYPCGWVRVLNKPCPTCGMTTAFAHAADSRLDRALIVQPMGAILAVGTAAGFWTALHVAFTGSRLGSICATMFRPWGVWTLAGLTAAAWAYKMLTWTGRA